VRELESSRKLRNESCGREFVPVKEVKENITGEPKPQFVGGDIEANEW
jgi:hypothetical protein